MRHRYFNIGGYLKPELEALNKDEVFIAIRSKGYYLWRAVDQDGDVTDIPAPKH
jgi:transposase-like protein